MSSRIDPHDPRFELERQDNIALLALGEAVDPEFEAHRATCSQCQNDVGALSHTVGLAREIEQRGEEMPPAAVWSSIAAELGFDAPKKEAPAAVDELSKRRRRHWRAGLAAAAAVLVAVAGGVGFLVGQGTESTAVTAASHAELSPQPGGPASVTGTANVHATSTGGHQLTVSSAGLPLRHGYYEVWLYDAKSGGMQPVGALADNGSGTYTLAGSIDLRSYDIVDVSAQEYGGSTVVHQQSVLRGSLTQ